MAQPQRARACWTLVHMLRSLWQHNQSQPSRKKLILSTILPQFRMKTRTWVESEIWKEGHIQNPLHKTFQHGRAQIYTGRNVHDLLSGFPGEPWGRRTCFPVFTLNLVRGGSTANHLLPKCVLTGKAGAESGLQENDLDLALGRW